MPIISIHDVTYLERSRKGMISRQLDWESWSNKSRHYRPR
ncbi:hypothetical protein CSPAE12_06074 [Colletotrichum incanum]|nr:hypothetical protein CSPAE12_06074 [Colletotrichum incanum]